VDAGATVIAYTTSKDVIWKNSGTDEDVSPSAAVLASQLRLFSPTPNKSITNPTPVHFLEPGTTKNVVRTELAPDVS
jgi:hypothetical protein